MNHLHTGTELSPKRLCIQMSDSRRFPT